MKLFNKTIDRQLFKQYSLGSDLSKQEVVVKIFNPTGQGNWFILNSDPEDPDYLWAIVDLGYGAEVGSVSRSELENYRGRFGLGFERDLGFTPINAEELYKGLRKGEYYADGGEVSFIEYKDTEIMHEPIYGKYYANDVEFDSLQEAKDFLDSGEIDPSIRDAYKRGLFADGGEIEVVYERRADFKKKPIKLLLLNKGKEQKGFTFSGKDQVAVLENYNRNKQEDLEKLWNLKGYESKYADGGDIESFSDNQRMIMNQNVELEHHHEELEDILENEVPVPAWVVAKMATATQSVSDVTHYLDGQKEIKEDELDDDDDDELVEVENIKDTEVIEPVNVSAGTKAELTKKFTNDAWGNLKGFLKGMEGIDLRDDYTFDYKNEQYEVEPIINSDENGVSNAVFSIFNGDGEEVGEVAYSREGGKQKFTANSEFFSWNDAKFEDGGFMNNFYADGGYFDGTIPNVSAYMSTYADGGEMNFTKDLTNKEFYEEVKSKVGNSIWEQNALNILRNESIKNPNGKINLTGDLDSLQKYISNGSSYAKGGEVAKAEVFGLKRNIMGTTDIEMKISGMRKAQDFIVYPIGKDDTDQIIKIQSETRIGKIDLKTGRGLMSQSHSNGAYFVHLQMDKLTPFTISESDLEAIKAHIFKTAGSNVGTRGIVSDNSGASRLLANGGNVGNEFNYMLLGRLVSDCDYYLGNGNRYEKHLWAGDVDSQIKKMKELWNGFPEDAKPEWLSMKDILDYEKKMKNQYAKGGNFEKVRWQDVEKGDSARVKELNRMGLITHIYGRKFNLKFPNGTEKTFDASDLEFFKLEKDQYEIDNHNNYAKGGNLDVVDLYNDYYIKGYENKAYQFAYVPEFSGKESVIAYSLGLEDGDKRNKKDYESFEEAISKVEQKTNKPKYINHNDIKTVTLKRNGKEVTYKGDDVLNGANVLADGGDITSKANYVPKRDVVEVELKDGTTVKPVNGYWVKKGAEPISNEPTPTSSDSKIGTTEIRKDPRGNWRAETKIENFNNYDWKITTIKTSSGNLLTSAQGGKYEQGNGYTTFKFIVFQDPNHTLEVSKPKRLTDKVVSEQHNKGLDKFKRFMETGMFKGGGKISNFDKLSDKVAKQYEGKPVQSQYQEEYGKYYSKEEAQEVGDKVAGKVKAMQANKKENGGRVSMKEANDLAKQIRKEGESWNDAKKRAFAQLKKYDE